MVVITVIECDYCAREMEEPDDVFADDVNFLGGAEPENYPDPEYERQCESCYLTHHKVSKPQGYVPNQPTVVIPARLYR